MMMNTNSKKTRNPNAGFSLVELMVAMTLGLILLAGVVAVMTNTSASYGELNKASRQLDNGRYAIQVLREDIRHAGYYGEFFDIPVPAAMTNPCSTTLADLHDGMNLPLQGFAGGVSAPLPCLTGYVSNTDVLVVRRAATEVTPTAAMLGSEVYLQSRSDRRVLESGPFDSAVFDLVKRDGSAADVRRYLVHIYYIRNCSDCTGGGDGIPTLTRLEFAGGGFTNTAPIAEGIEALRLQYGIDTSGDGVANQMVALPANLGEWSSLISVEVGLLARNVEPSNGYSDTKTYTLSGVSVGPFNDRFKRHAYTTLARAVNPGDRRVQ
jgi:type IV pilus assembly protein PilW